MRARRSTLLLAFSSTAAAFNAGSKSPLGSIKLGKSAGKKAVAISIDVPINLPEANPKPSYSLLDPEDAWIANLDYDAFGIEVAALGKELLKETVLYKRVL